MEEVIREELNVVRKVVEHAMVALDYLQKGQEKEFLEATGELYFESTKSEARTAIKYVKLVIIQLFNLKYTRDNNHEYFKDEIHESMINIIDITNWDMEKKVDPVIELINQDMNLAYARAIREFQRILEKNPEDYKINSTKNLPEECPWTLENIMDDPIEDLLIVLK